MFLSGETPLHGDWERAELSASTTLRSISSVGLRASAFQAERRGLPRLMLLHFIVAMTNRAVAVL